MSEPAAPAEPVVIDPARRARAVGVLAVIGALVVAADQLTKQWALSGLSADEPVRILGGAVYLSLTRNSGAAFSMFEQYTFVFPVITAIVVTCIAVAARRLQAMPWAIAFGLVLGGALGNFTDRIVRAPGPFVGHVVDMISVFAPYGERFPVFNLADSSLVVGVCLAVLLELTGRQRDGGRLGSRPTRTKPPAARD